MRHALYRSTAFLLLVLILSACASSTGFVVSGESLDAAGKAFVVVGQTYNREFDAKRLAPNQYKAWADFATKFKAAYPPAVQLWKSSVAVNDAALQKETAALVASLVNELITLGSVVGVQVFK